MLPICEKFKPFTSDALVICFPGFGGTRRRIRKSEPGWDRLHEVVIVGVGICVREDYGSAYGRSFNVPDDPIRKVIRVHTISF